MIISGDKYSAVPQKEFANSFLEAILARPKSARTRYPSSPKSIFSGFKSLYRMLLE
jgi:hypothetical protein